MTLLKHFIILICLLLGSNVYSQITVTNTQTPEELVNEVLVGAGVEISNVEFNHSIPLASAVQTQAGYFNAAGTDFPISEGVVLASGHVRLAEGPNDSGSATDNEGVAPDPNDLDLAAIGTATINNEAVLEFDFIPSGDSVAFRYVFGSEEYLEYVDAGFNDVFGFFISGPGFAGPYEDGAENIATIPGTATPVTIDNLNDEDYPELYVNNDDGIAVQYDGHTVVLTASASVVCGETYHIKIALGDAGDSSLDSGVFLEASSFSSNGVTVEIASVLGEDALIEGCDSAMVSFIRPEGSDTTELTVDYEIGGTAINGTDYDLLDESVFFPIGEDTITKYIVPIDDGITEGAETVTITVEIINECGDTIVTEATIEIIDPQDFDVITEDVLIDCAEDSVMITFDTDGGVPEFDIDWSSGGTEVEEWVPGDIVGSTTYTVTVTDVCGVTSTGELDVIFDPASSASITFNEDLFIICPGEEITIDATVVDPYDAGEVTYEWDPTGEVTEDITITPEEEGWYYLTVFDGCAYITDSTKVEFGEIDLDDITVVDAIDCPGIDGAALGSISVLPDDSDWTYELVGYGDPQDNGNFDDLAGGIDYLLVVTDENGCFIDTIVPVELGENAVVATWVEDSLRNISCFGANDGGAYVYEIEGGITPPYDVTWTTVGGVFDTETVGVDGESEQDDLTGGTWVVTVTDQEGCAWSHSFEILEPEELTLELTWNEPTCYGFSDGSITVNTSGGNGGEIYVMTDEDGEVLNEDNSNTINTLPTGTYYITVTDQNGCTVSATQFLDEPGELDVDLNVTQPACFGIPTGVAEIDTVFNYTGPFEGISYFWTPNPSGENGIGATFNNHLGEGDHTLTINDANGCSKVFDFEIIYPDEIVFSELGHDPAYCRVEDYQNGNGVAYASAIGGTGTLGYQWTNLETEETSINSTYGGLNPGDYEIKVTDGNGCTLIDTITVDSLNPVADFDIISEDLNADHQGTAPVYAEFQNQSENYNNPNSPTGEPRFYWNLNSPYDAWQITADYDQTYDTTYLARGETYTIDVCLVAQNKNGCKDTACKVITIYEPFVFPDVNVFTPDGDGINDNFTFGIDAKSVAEFECIIVNRWGNTITTFDSVFDEWDGTNNGTPCPDGVYFYTYTGRTDNNIKFEGQGTVTIKRIK